MAGRRGCNGPIATSEVPGLKRDADGKYHRADRVGAGSAERIHRCARRRRPAGDPDLRRGLRRASHQSAPSRTITSSFSSSGARSSGRRATDPGRRATAASSITCMRRRASDGRTWARSVELQIQEHDVGDLYAVGSAIAVRAKARPGTKPTLYDYDPTGEWTFFSQSQGSPGRCIKQPDNEKPTGEWNTVELIALPRRFDSHREWQSGDAAPRPGADRRRPADAGDIGTDHSAVRGRGSFLPRHPDPADYRDPGGVCSESASTIRRDQGLGIRDTQPGRPVLPRREAGGTAWGGGSRAGVSSHLTPESILVTGSEPLVQSRKGM